MGVMADDQIGPGLGDASEGRCQVRRRKGDVFDPAVADHEDDVNPRPDRTDAVHDRVDFPSEYPGPGDGGSQILPFAEIDDPDADAVKIDNQGPVGLFNGHARPDRTDGVLAQQIQGLPEGLRSVIEDMIVSQRDDLERDRGQPADMDRTALKDRTALPSRGGVSGQRAFQIDDAQIALAQDGQHITVDRLGRTRDDLVESPDGRPVGCDDDFGLSPGSLCVHPSAPAPVKPFQSGLGHLCALRFGLFYPALLSRDAAFIAGTASRMNAKRRRFSTVGV